MSHADDNRGYCLVCKCTGVEMFDDFVCLKCAREG